MTGQLALKIQGHTPACLRSAEWVDHDDAKLETKLSEIVAGIVVTAAFVNQVEADRARAEQARWDAQVAARRQADEEAAELKRKQALVTAAGAWRDAALVRDYVAAVHAAIADGKAEVSSDQLLTWTTWANTIAETMSRNAMEALPGASTESPEVEAT